MKFEFEFTDFEIVVDCRITGKRVKNSTTLYITGIVAIRILFLKKSSFPDSDHLQRLVYCCTYILIGICIQITHIKQIKKKLINSIQHILINSDFFSMREKKINKLKNSPLGFRVHYHNRKEKLLIL